MPQPSDEREALLRERFSKVNFLSFIGVNLESSGEGFCRMSLDIRPELKQGQGVLHGGVTAALVDTSIAFAIATLLEPGLETTTVELKLNYLLPIREGRVIAEARVIRKGRNLVVSEADILDQDGRLAAKGMATYMILRR